MLNSEIVLFKYKFNYECDVELLSYFQMIYLLKKLKYKL